MAKILLVEDDNNLREIYEARLQAEGYDIVSARDGEEALTVAMKERPDLIISDVMMPKISGFDMLDIIRSTTETKDVKVIMMTALSQAEDKERAAKLGADRYLVKSQVTLEDVAKVAREVLNGESGVITPTEPKTEDKPAEEPDEISTPPAVVPAPTTSVPTVPAPVNDPMPDTTVQPAPEPVAAAPTVAPTPVVATPIASEPVVAIPTVAPTVVAPAPQPAITTPSTPAPAANVAMSAVTPDPVSDSTKVVGQQSVEDEQSAIAAQIESFIDSKKNSAAPTDTPATVPATDTKEAAAAPVPVPVVTAPETSDEAAVAPEKKNKAGKKIIQPLSDPSVPSGPDINKLLEKEVEKDKMAQIAQEVANKSSDTTVGTPPANNVRLTTDTVATETPPEAVHEAPAEPTTAVAPAATPTAAPANPVTTPVQPTSPPTVDGVDPSAISL